MDGAKLAADTIDHLKDEW